MNQTWLKRASALLLSATMAASVFPTTAFAVEQTEETGSSTPSSSYQTDSQTEGDNSTAPAAGESDNSGSSSESSGTTDGSTTNNAANDTTTPTETDNSNANDATNDSDIDTQEDDSATPVDDTPSEPATLGSIWLTELNPNDYDGYNKGKYGLTKADDLFEYVELINTSDQAIHFNDDYELLYNSTAISAKNLDGSEDVVIQPGEVLVLWNQRTNVKNTATVEDFRTRYFISDDVHIAVADYGANWGNSGTFALRAKATGTVFSDYSYVNGTIDKSDGADIADGLVVDLAIPTTGTTMAPATRKTYASPGYVYSEQLGDSTKPTNNSALIVTEVYSNDKDRSSTYTGITDDLMEFVEVTNTTDEDIDFNESYQFQYLYKTQGARLAICTYEDAHKEANGEVSISDLYNKSGIVIKAHSSAVFWCYRERNLGSNFTKKGLTYPTESDFRADFNIADDVSVYCMIGQNGMKNTDRGVAITQQQDGRQVMLSYYHYNGITDLKDKKSVCLASSAEGPRMNISASLQTPSPGSTSSNQLNFPDDDGSKISLSVREGTTIPEYIMQGDELRVRFDYAVTGTLPRTKIATYYRFDGEGSWNVSSETTRRVPGLYESNISADELFDHSKVEFYVVASNQYHQTVTEVYTVEIHKLNDEIDGIRTNISDKEEIGGSVTITANNGGDNATTKILIDGEEQATEKMLEDGAYYTFKTSGRDSYFRNALVVADDNLTDDTKLQKIASLVKWQYYSLNGYAVHIDNQYFTYDAESDSYKITLRFWAGTYGTTTYDYLLPDGNKEDFQVSELQLKLITGETFLPDSIGPSSFTNPSTGETTDTSAKTNLSTALSTVHNIGDSANMCPYLDATFSIPASKVNAVGVTVDTTAMSEGKHTLTVTDGTSTKAVTFIVDNTKPEIDMGIVDQQVLSGDIQLAPKITEANTLEESIITLDDERVNDTVETDSVTLGAGEHTLTVYARDAAGNENTQSVTFQVSDDAIAVIDASTNDVTASSATLSVTTSGNTTDATATFYKLNELDASSIETATTEGILPYITYTLDVGTVADTANLIVNWNGTASNADSTHASKLFAKNFTNDSWDEIGSADEEGSIDATFAAADHVSDGKAVIMVQCTADSALPDLTGTTDGNTETQNWDGYSVPASYDFAFAWETDTQYYSEEYFQHYLNMNNWIVDNADALNIRYVIHTGDIVDDFDMVYEWENADRAMKILDDAGISYGVLGGNHDVAAATFEYENYYKYFGEDRVKNQSTYGGSYKNNLGHYDLLTENGQDFIIVYMSWDIYQDEIDWMNQVLAQYSDRKAILCFHTYTRVAYNADGTLGDYYGNLIEQEVVAKNSNVFAVLNGHYHGASYETTVFDDNNDGVYDRTVYQICTDYQSGFEGGSGYIKMLYFDLDNNKIYINSYSPSLDDYNYYDNTAVTELGTDDASTVVATSVNSDGSANAQNINSNLDTDILTLNVNFHTDPQTILASYCNVYVDSGEELGTAAVDAQTNTAQLNVSGLNAETSYAWYATVQNGLGSSFTTDVQHFTTLAAPVTPDSDKTDTNPTPSDGDTTPTDTTNTTNTTDTTQTGTQTNATTNTQSSANATKTTAAKTADNAPAVIVSIVIAASAIALTVLRVCTRRKEVK